MGKRFRRFVAIFLCITSVLIVCMPASVSQASTKVGDFEMDGDTLIRYTGTEENLTILNGVRNIGKEAFAGNTSLKKVIIPDTVKNIDFAAFENCPELMQVVIPSGVKSIGASAFSGCSNLRYINIPDKCEQIGSAAFAKCERLSEITVDPYNTLFVCLDGVLYTSDGKKLIQYLAGRTSGMYNMPSSIESIEEYAFWGSPQLTDVSISSKVSEIPEYAFANCSGLTNVVIPYNVKSLQAYSFSDCYNLRNVIIPDTVGYIDEKAFYLTDDVEFNYYDSDDARQLIDGAGIEQEDFSEYSDRIVGSDYDIFVSGSANEKTVLSEMPYVEGGVSSNSVTRLPGELASARISGGHAYLEVPRDVLVRGYNIVQAEGEDGTPYTYIDPDLGGSYNVVGNVFARYRGSDSKPVLPMGIGKIGNRAFYKNDRVESLVVPAGVSEIGDFAFARSSVERVSLPEGIDRIGYAAFYNCANLEDIIIPDSVRTIELGAFDGCKWMDERLAKDDGNDFIVAGQGILIGYKGNGGDVSVPAGVKAIGPGCFAGNKGITSVTLPQGLEKIGEEAFLGCAGIRDVTIPDTVTDIEDRAFKNCPLDQVIIPAGVRNIGLGAFDRTEVQESGVDRTGAVVFLGNELPSLSYKNTATRLSASDLRTYAFAGFDNAIVGSDVDISEDSVLSPSNNGFRGQVYVITSDASADNGQLRLKNSYARPVDAEGNVVIDPHVTINGKKYIMSGVTEGAFGSYTDPSLIDSADIRSVSIQGNTSDNVNDMLSRISQELSSRKNVVNEADDSSNEKIIPIDVEDGVSPDRGNAFASITGDDGDYHISVSRSPESEYLCNSAFVSKFGSTDGINMVPLDITMTDVRSGVEIKRLSGHSVDLELPIPSEFIQEQNIMVGALNDNGELETIPSSIVNYGGNDKIRFIASHFSTYVIYTSLEQTTVLNTVNRQNLSLPAQIAVMETLNREVGFTSVKWYIGAVFLMMGLVLLLANKRHPVLKKENE
ncbi:MAG: leucine-rich repeat domain-containing protein [Lachnospiraceae bacterium]|nr:leucine-rich repeat domain-containing protein [Lachnospiraceae bacterium]